MPQVTKIDKALNTELSKTNKPSHFAFAPGSKNHGLVISKKPIKGELLTKAKARSGGTKVLRGTCQKVKGVLTFFTHGQSFPELKKKSLETTIFELTNKNVTCTIDATKDKPYDEDAVFEDVPEVRDQTDEVESEEVESEEVESEEESKPTPVPTDSHQAEKLILGRLKGLQPAYQKLIAGLKSKEAGELKSLMGQVNHAISEKDFTEANKHLDSLRDKIKLLLPTLIEKKEIEDEPEDLGETLNEMFDEEPGEFETRLKKIFPRYKLAVEKNQDLKEYMDQATDYAEEKDFRLACNVLDALELQIDKLDKDWNPYRYKLKAFQQTLKMAERMKESPLPETVELGKQILSCHEDALRFAEKKEFKNALDALVKGEELAKQARQKIELAKREAEKDRNTHAEREKEVFGFESRMKDKDWGFDTDDDAMNFMLGNVPDENGTLVKSPKLLAMEEVLAQCLKRRDQMVQLGADPVESALEAFGNIPKNFWPDSVVRECVMFQRAQEHFASIQQAEEDGKTLLAALSEKLDTAGTIVGQLRTPIKQVHKKVGVKDKETNQVDQQKVGEVKGMLAKAGWKPSTDELTLMDDILSGVLIGIKPFASVLGSASSLVTAIDKGVQALGIDDNPVEKKKLEFERNLALIEAASQLIDAGCSLAKGIVPALGALGYGKKALEALAHAVRYFEKLAEIAAIKDVAKLDPNSMMLLPLAHEARNRKIQASKKLVDAVAAMMRATGSVLENIPEPGTAAAGVVFDAVGKCVKVGGKVVFQGIAWSDAKKAKNDMKKAAGPPPNRKAMTMIFKHHARYAKYAICAAAIEDNDPWANAYLLKQNLTEDDLAHPNTSVQILREYLHVVTEEKEEMKTFSETIKWKDIKEKGEAVVEKLRDLGDKITDRDTSHPLNDKWRAPDVDLTRKNWQDVKVLAIRAGWYEDRGGIGELLDMYNIAEAEYDEAVDEDNEIDVINSVLSALGEVRSKLLSTNPVAVDRKTPHPGMVDYFNRLAVLTSQRESELTAHRGELLNALQLGGGTPQEIEVKKKEFMQQSVEKAQVANIERMGNRKLAIQGLWETSPFTTPYGKCTVLQFAAIAAKKLGLNDQARDNLHTDCVHLHLECLELLYERLAGVADDELDDEFKLQSRDLYGKLAGGLRSLCASYYSEVLEEGGGKDSGEDDWEPSDFTLSSSNWSAVKKEAGKHGYVNEKTGVAEALKDFEKYYQAVQTSSTDIMSQRLAAGTLMILEEKLRDFQPFNKIGLPHSGMATFRTKLLAELSQRKEELNKLLDTGAGQWKAPAPDLDPESWAEAKKGAIEHGLKDKKTGIGAALKTFTEAEKKFNAQSDSPKTRNDLAKAIKELDKKLSKFKPINEIKRPHAPMVAYKEKMLQALAKFRNSLDKQTTGALQLSDFTLSRAAWQKNKESAGQSGMKPAKSGVGKALDEYTSKLQAHLSKPAERKLRLEFANAAEELEKTLQKFRPKDDFGEPHMPMVEYREKLIEEINKKRAEVAKAAAGTWNAWNFDLSGGAWRTNKEQATEHGMKDQGTGLGELLDEVAKTEKPYEKKTTDREAKVAYIAALTEARKGFIALTPVDEFGQPFPPLTQYRQRMIKEVDNRLTGLEEAEEKNWAAPPVVMSAEGWSNAKAQAIAHGMVKGDTGIKGAFEEMRKAEKEFEKSKGDQEKRQLYVNTLDHVIDCFKKFGPIDDFGKPFKPMVTYRDRMIQELKNHRDNLEEVNTVDWQPSNFSLTKAAWQQAKQEAIVAGWVEEETGLTPALEAFEKAHKTYAQKPKDRKARIKILDSLDGVKKALEGFNPVNDFKKPHQGMLTYRREMLAEVKRRTDEVEKNAGTPWTPTNFAFTKDAWQETKRDALRDGWVESKSNVGDALDLYHKAHTKHREKPFDDKVKKLLLKACGEVAQRLGALKCVRSDKSPHAGMALYRETMLTNLSTFERDLDEEE